MKTFLLCVFMVLLLVYRMDNAISDVKRKDIIDDEWKNRR